MPAPTMTVRKYTIVLLSTALIIVLGIAGLLGGGNGVQDVAYETTASGKGMSSGKCATFNGKRTIVVCVPAKTPLGSPVKKIFEDQSSVYANGAVFDPDTMSVRAG